jgi:hypothetical protein
MYKLRNTIWIATVLLVGLMTAGCASNAIDDPDSPNVVVTVQTLTIPPVTAAEDPNNAGACLFTVADATATLRSQPKSEPADNSPFNDTVMESVEISYLWDDGTPMAPAAFGVSGTVPVGGTASVLFPAVPAGALTSGLASHTASLDLVFRGHTVSGDEVVVPTGGSLTITGSCP